jgi:phosphoribosylanthranilate isomerase
MSTDIKFCGLTKAEDVQVAVELRASFVGAVFAGGPRAITAEQARSLFASVEGTRRVGVFGDQGRDEIARAAERAAVDVIQLHADPTPEMVSAIKRLSGLETWAAVRVANAPDDGMLDALISSADAIVYDTRAEGALGGTGRTFDWGVLANALDRERRVRARVVLAGGLTPALAPLAIDALHPDVVDVSSGVESAPGVKDHDLMRAFAAAVRGAR